MAVGEEKPVNVSSANNLICTYDAFKLEIIGSLVLVHQLLREM